jgi:hypothetical protein
MKKWTRLKIVPFVLLVLLVTLALWMLKREGATAEEDADNTIRAAVRLQHSVDREGYAVVAFVILAALVTFITWTAFRADKGEDEAASSTGESSSPTNR